MQEELPVALQIAVLAIQLGIILFAAKFCGKLAAKIHIPSVLGELVAGIVIGPYVLGAVGLSLHGFEHGLFPLQQGGIPVSTTLYALATLGSIVLLFMSGLETDLRMFFRYSLVGTVVGLGGVIFSYVFGAVLGMMMFHSGIMDPRCMFLGILCTATSVGITARILSEKKSIDSPEGTTILAAAVIDDVLGIICLAIVMGIVGAAAGGNGQVDWNGIGWIALKSIGIWLGITAIGLISAHKIASFLKIFPPSSSFATLAFGLSLILAGLFEQFGLAMIVGAYVMGLSLSKTDLSFTIQRHLNGIYNFLVPVFFVVMGMLVNVKVFAEWNVLKFGLIYSLLAILAKVIGCALPALFMNFRMLGALRIGMGMIPRGEVALIIAGIGSTTMMMLDGVKVPIINSELFGIAIIMTLVTTLAAPPLLSMMLGIKGSGVKKEVKDEKSVYTTYTLPSEVIREFVLRIMMDNFRQEGFRNSKLDREGGITHFRRVGTTFTMQLQNNDLIFESNPSEVALIRTVMYETFVEIHHAMSKLKELASPGTMQEAVTAPGTPDDKGTVKIEKVIGPTSVLYRLHAKTMEDAIRELVENLRAAGRLKDAEKCTRDVLARESVVSTCMPGGIALPHARTDGSEHLVSAVGISREGILVPGQKEPTRIFVLSVCPKSASAPYLQFVSHIARVLMTQGNISVILNAENADAIRDIFIRTNK